MCELPGHFIPEDIRKLEFGTDEQRNLILPEIQKIFLDSEFKVFDTPEMLTSKYIDKFTTLLHMQEAASCKELDQFDLFGVKIKVDKEHRTIQVVSIL